MNGCNLFSKRYGFTLVELLVVISIIGILMAMVLPAIQSARESGRRTQCLNHVRNLGQGTLLHLTAHQQYPTGGWGFAWGGDPDRGFDRRQPGGWGYNLLPFIEERTLHDRGWSGDPKTFTTAKKEASKIRFSTVISLYLCPSRNREGLGGVSSNWHGHVNIDSSGLTTFAKTDFAMNGGNSISGFPIGPAVSALGADDSTLDSNFSAIYLNGNGVSHVRSQIRAEHVKDGTSKTYLIGEKYLNFTSSADPTSGDDNQSWEVGYDWDTYRFTVQPPQFDQNTNSSSSNSFFGSAHAMAFNMVMCDGSTRSIPYDIDPAIHLALGNRKDGGPTEAIP